MPQQPCSYQRQGAEGGRGENNLIFERARVELNVNLKLLSISCSLIRDYVVCELVWQVERRRGWGRRGLGAGGLIRAVCELRLNGINPTPLRALASN